MKKFEYNYSIVDRGEDAALKTMDELGVNGWEVVSIHYKPEGLLGKYIIFYKREWIEKPS